MTIDPYSFCPCGNGKKFKFCKCVEQPQEYEKVVKLLEGGQGLAGLERLTSLLQKTPNAAWILALRGETALALREMDLYQENTDRFIALQPDNPLALTMKCISIFLSLGPAQEAVRNLADALAESRDSIPSLVPQAINILLSDLARTAKLHLAGPWVGMLQQLSDDEAQIRNLVRAIPNTLARYPTQLKVAPVSPDCRERLAEVEALTGAFQHRQAESKLRSILRDFPTEERALQLLLQSQLILLDEDGVQSTLAKLCEVGKAEPKYVYQALTWALQSTTALHVGQRNDLYMIDDEEELLKKLSEHELVTEMSDGESEQIRTDFANSLQEEVPPKLAFAIHDRPLQLGKEGEDDSEISSLVGLLLVFGKQTDKPARVLANLRSSTEDDAVCAPLLESLNLGEQIESDLPSSIPYRFALERSRVHLNGAPLSTAELSARVVEDLLNMSFDEIGGTPLSAKENEEQLENLQALLIHFECQQDLVLERKDMDELYQRLGQTREQIPDTDVSHPTYLALQEVGSLSNEKLTEHFMLVHNLRLERASYQGARELNSRDDITLEPALRAAMLSELLEAEPYHSDQSLELLSGMEECYVQLEQSPGMIVMERIQRMIARGMEGEARQEFVRAMSQYPNDPVLMTVMQRSQSAMQPRAEDISSNAILSRPKAAPDPDSGLILPGQEQGGGGDESDSKLWLPGS